MPDPMATPAKTLESAIAHHRAGRLPQARKLYRKLIKRRPAPADALHLLGVVEHQTGNSSEGAKLVQRALRAKPHTPSFMNSLAEIYRVQGRLDDAIETMRIAVGRKWDYPEAHNTLGNIHRARGELDDAERAYREALKQRPVFAAALNGLGAVAKDRGQLERALALFGEVEAIDPHLDQLQLNQGLLLEQMGVSSKAIIHLKAAMLSGQGEAESALVRALGQVRFSKADPWFEAFILRKLDEPNVDHGPLGTAALSLLFMKPSIRGLSRGGAADDEALSALAQEPLLLSVLRRVVAPELRFESLVRALRASLCARLDPRHLELMGAVAEQAFFTEYVYWPFADDPGPPQSLDSPAQVAAFASYRPLIEAPSPEQLLGRGWPEPVQRLVKLTLEEPLQERAIRGRLQRITSITGLVSRAVRSQYEAHPYPRWLKLPPVSQGGLKETLRARNPRAFEAASWRDRPRVLIAGSGTGRHPIHFAKRHPESEVLAIDLSSASLSYATRKAQEIGAPNLRFAQADLLNLPDEIGPFEVIESVGVLHHLEDPMAGWRRLTALLVPGGVMKIGLYSQRARTAVNKARALIQAQGIGSSSEEIRAFRERAVSDPKLEPLMNWRDFFTTSECRDLIFHVQEHQFTIPMIKDALDRLALRFLGFAFLDVTTEARYRGFAGFDAPMDDLEAWEQFEQAEPSTFRGMYQFYCQKPVI